MFEFTCVGGPLDGVRIELPARVARFDCPVPRPVKLSAPPDEFTKPPPNVQHVTYIVRRYAGVHGTSVFLASPEGEEHAPPTLGP